MVPATESAIWMDRMTDIIHRQQRIIRTLKRQLKAVHTIEALKCLKHSVFVCVETKRHMELTTALLNSYWSRYSFLALVSATKLLPGQDKSAPSPPTSRSAWFVVPCGFRLSEVGFGKFVNRRSKIRPQTQRLEFQSGANASTMVGSPRLHQTALRATRWPLFRTIVIAPADKCLQWFGLLARSGGSPGRSLSSLRRRITPPAFFPPGLSISNRLHLSLRGPRYKRL